MRDEQESLILRMIHPLKFVNSGDRCRGTKIGISPSVRSPVCASGMGYVLFLTACSTLGAARGMWPIGNVEHSHKLEIHSTGSLPMDVQ